MDWVTCPKCGFTQIPSEKCLRCERLLNSQEKAARRASRPRPPVPPPSAPSRASRSPVPFVLAGAVVLLALTALLVWRARAKPPLETALPTPEVSRPGQALDLAGRWRAQISKTLPGPPPRPVLKEVSLETDRDGSIQAAHVFLTDPGRGGAGAGYRIATDGPRRLGEAAMLLSTEPAGASLPLDFIPFPPWVPNRSRLWRALEGQTRNPQDVRYLLLESVEDDYVVQAGINRSGFLSYAFFSPAYATGRRGVDILSRVIHPAADSSLRGFRDVIWDLSGAADFLEMRVHAVVSGPEGIPDHLTLTR